MVPRFTGNIMTLVALGLFLLAGCQPRANAEPELVTVSSREPASVQAITLGDIDAEAPAKKIQRFQPLADYLASNLEEYGIQEGRVIIAKDIEQMAQFLSAGTVDVYFDSPYPTLAVQEMARSRVILRRWKQGVPSYWSTYIALRDSGIASPEGLLGKVIAFEDPVSTSGFVLPAGTLVQQGFTLTQVDGPGEIIDPFKIGYFFSEHEDNTVELLLRGSVAGAGVSNQDYDKFSEELKERVVAFDRTVAVPRQLVSARRDLSPELTAQIRELLIGLEHEEGSEELLAGLKNTTRFDELPDESTAALEQLGQLIRLVRE